MPRAMGSLPMPVGSLDAYMNALSQIPILEKSQEQDLARRFRDQGDLEAARELVLSHLRFVVYIARGYGGYGLPLADLVQEGNVGLMRAVKRFDPDVGVRLVTFAVHWIRAEIHEFVVRNWRLVKVATTKAQRKLFFNLRKKRARLGWLSVSEREQIANDLKVSVRDVEEMEKRLAARDPAFDGREDPHEDNGVTYSPANYLPAPASDPAQLVSEGQWQQFTAEKLAVALTELDARSRDIIQSRYLTDKKTTFKVLAERYQVSVERIRQLEVAAIKKLRQAVNESDVIEG
ncbi:MAG: RNA polymerase sigma factor RpoH [Gammaproteobacteria bacterium]|nr:RNA polymerase sigma factor RpoH [Gammaproteobacteria bacterium]